ncbi:MAG: DegT/DnrJ/EryC1/StrS family aminotransferase [Planctomycetes bacterium]|nr:DegT/DnrJ/EryC1/StrS family aminotransferase [Planctomycetota bacterium]
MTVEFTPPADFLEAVRALRAKYPEAPPSESLPLAVNTLEDEEIAAALEALIRGPVTLGKRTLAFEEEFAASQGAKHAVYVSSGSAANLLVLALLAYPDGLSAEPAPPVLAPGDEVIVPAVTWSTTIWPVAQVGAVPVLADVDPRTLNLTVESVERAISPKTRAVFAVHLLGNPAPVDALRALCDERGLTLIEDTCEALDAELGGRKAGTFGRLGTYSFYFSHHMTTIEGGMVVCDSAEDADRLRALRAHGWTRHLSPACRSAVEGRHAEIDSRFLFVERGFNCRNTDVHAAIGRIQLRRRGEFLARRRLVAAAWAPTRDSLADLFLPMKIEPGSSHFAFPLVLAPEAKVERGALIKFLEARGVATRPLVAGNLARQPAMRATTHRCAGDLAGAQLLHERAIYIGIHSSMTDAQLTLIPDLLAEFAAQVVG